MSVQGLNYVKDYERQVSKEIFNSITSKKICNSFLIGETDVNFKTKHKFFMLYLYVNGIDDVDRNNIVYTKTFLTFSQILDSNLFKYQNENKESRRAFRKFVNSFNIHNTYFQLVEEPTYFSFSSWISTRDIRSGYTKLDVDIIKRPSFYKLSYSEIVIYYILKAYTFGKSYCYISLDTLKDKTGLSKQTIINNIYYLEYKDIIKVDRNKNKKNVYYLKEKDVYYLHRYMINLQNVYRAEELYNYNKANNLVNDVDLI